MSEERGGRAREAGPLSSALTEVGDLLSGESGTSRRFLGGLVIGALVGAAIAGGTFLRTRTTGPVAARPRPGPAPEPRR